MKLGAGQGDDSVASVRRPSGTRPSLPLPAIARLKRTETVSRPSSAIMPRLALSEDSMLPVTASYVGVRFVSDRTIDSHVRHIRAKFQSVGGDPIETVHGVGYRLAAT